MTKTTRSTRFLRYATPNADHPHLYISILRAPQTARNLTQPEAVQREPVTYQGAELLHTCPHCGDEHGSSECRAALAVRLAESINAHIEDAQHMAVLDLQVQDLRRQVILLQIERG